MPGTRYLVFNSRRRLDCSQPYIFAFPQVPIAHAEEVEQVFDAISYCKGACVVKMLNAVVGMDLFKKGLQVGRGAFITVLLRSTRY